MKNVILFIVLILVHTASIFGQTVMKIESEDTDSSQSTCQLGDVNRVITTNEDVTLTASPAVLTTGGAVAALTATLTSTATSFQCTSKPSWVSSVTFSGNIVTINVSENTTAALIREDNVVIATSSGDSPFNILVKQGGHNANLIYESLGSGSLPADWITMGTGSNVNYGNGYVNLAAVDFLNANATRMVCKVAGSEVTSGMGSTGNIVVASVDFKGTSNAGIFIYLNDANPENCFQFFSNITGNSGYLYAFKGFSGGALALGDPIPGDPMNYGGTKGLPVVEPIPSSGIDAYFRMEITNSYNLPYWWQYQVSIWSLKTTNGVTSKYKLHYTRKFETNTPGVPLPGYFGIWVKGGGESQFSNFMLSAQNNLNTNTSNLLNEKLTVFQNGNNLYLKGIECSEFMKADIFNSMGQAMFSKSQLSSEPINTASLQSGIYILKLNNNQSFKFIKK
jgi:hypothetical protein